MDVTHKIVTRPPTCTLCHDQGCVNRKRPVATARFANQNNFLYCATLRDNTDIPNLSFGRITRGFISSTLGNHFLQHGGQLFRILEINLRSRVPGIGLFNCLSIRFISIYIQGEKQSIEASFVQMIGSYPVGVCPHQDVLNLDDLGTLEL